MIKFRCPNCDQKLGVPDAYAGKRVRCSKCSQPCQVPAEQMIETPSPKPASVSAPQETAPAPAQHSARAAAASVQPSRPQPAPVAPPPADVDLEPEVDDNPFGDLDLDSLTGGPDSEALAAARQERYKQQAKSSRGSSRSAAIDSGSRGGGAVAGLALGAGKIPLSLAASLAFMIGVCLVWAFVAFCLHMDFFIFPFIVAAAGAGGLVMFTEKRNFGLGLLAVAMALLGILIGKGMIARWVVMPQVMEYFNSEDFGPQQALYKSLSAEEQQEKCDSEFLAYGVGTIELWKQGTFEEDVAQKLIFENIVRNNQEEGYEEEDTVSEWPDEHEAVCAHVDNWTAGGREKAFAAHYDTYWSTAMEGIKNSSVIKGLGFLAAFVGTFSIWDLLIIPFSLVTAWKIGTGKDTPA